jgi:hypothetical protein
MTARGVLVAVALSAATVTAIGALSICAVPIPSNQLAIVK